MRTDLERYYSDLLLLITINMTTVQVRFNTKTNTVILNNNVHSELQTEHCCFHSILTLKDAQCFSFIIMTNLWLEENKPTEQEINIII